MFNRLVILMTVLNISPVHAGENAAVLEVMGIIPGVTTVDETIAIVSADVKRVKCEQKDRSETLECRTKGEKESFTLAGNRVSLVFDATKDSSGDDLIRKATFDYREKGYRIKNEDARLLVRAFSTKFGEPTRTQDCEFNDTRMLLDDPIVARRTCAMWRDLSGRELSVVYRIRQDVMQALGGSEPDHFIQVEVLDASALTAPLVDDL